MAKKKEVCLTGSCKSYAKRRGQCDACYQAAKRAIADGDVTDSQLVEQGLRKPPYSKRSKFSKAIKG